MLWLMLLACDPIVLGLEEADTTAAMEWHSRVPDCDEDGLARVDVGSKWQFIQAFRYDKQEDRWGPDDWDLQDNEVAVLCGNTERYAVRIAWVNLP